MTWGKVVVRGLGGGPMLALLLALAGCGTAEFEGWALDICAQNDTIDREIAQQLPTRDVLMDINYLDKLRGFLQRKIALKAAVDAYEAPITRNALRTKLGIALNNSIRYLRTLEAQYQIAEKRYAEVGGDDDLPSDRDTTLGVQPVIRDLVTGQAAYQVDPREIMMKRQYEKLYAEVRAQLGLPPLPF